MEWVLQHRQRYFVHVKLVVLIQLVVAVAAKRHLDEFGFHKFITSSGRYFAMRRRIIGFRRIVFTDGRSLEMKINQMNLMEIESIFTVDHVATSMRLKFVDHHCILLESD